MNITPWIMKEKLLHGDQFMPKMQVQLKIHFVANAVKSCITKNGSRLLLQSKDLQSFALNLAVQRDSKGRATNGNIGFAKSISFA
jgi:hypothetical protein